MPVSNKRKVSLEALEIVAGLIRKDSTDARKHRMESLLLLTDDMRIFLESADMVNCAILCFGGDDGSNKEGLGSIGFNVISIVLIDRVGNNKDFFEDTDYNKTMYNSPLAATSNAIYSMQLLSALYVSGLRKILNILL